MSALQPKILTWAREIAGVSTGDRSMLEDDRAEPLEIVSSGMAERLIFRLARATTPF